MWSQVTVSDTQKIDRFCEIAELKQERRPSQARIRSEIARSGMSFYLYEDGPAGISLALGQTSRTGRYIICYLSYTPEISSQDFVDEFLSQLGEYATQHSVDQFYAVMSARITPEGSEKLGLLAAKPRVTLIQTPAPPDLIEVTLELDLTPVPP